MALYAIGDLHLSLGVKNKSMEIFGPAWENYVDRVGYALDDFTADDVLILDGDLSWGMTLQQAEADFRFLNQFPCQKWLVKGNHDYWWNTVSKMRAFFDEKGFENFDFIHNNCAFYENYALCGTRGWFLEEDPRNIKVLNREIQRLDTSCKAAGERDIICFLHYPPLYQGYSCKEILDKLREYHVKKCFYGHLHGPSIQRRLEGVIDGIDFALISADYLRFVPKKICD